MQSVSDFVDRLKLICAIFEAAVFINRGRLVEISNLISTRQEIVTAIWWYSEIATSLNLKCARSGNEATDKLAKLQ